MACFASLERDACKYAIDSIVPPYVFVIPAAPMDDFFNASPLNFTGRQDLWVNMFRLRRTTIEIIPGIEREVYQDLYGFIEDWWRYFYIAPPSPPIQCRVNTYSDL